MLLAERPLLDVRQLRILVSLAQQCFGFDAHDDFRSSSWMFPSTGQSVDLMHGAAYRSPMPMLFSWLHRVIKNKDAVCTGDGVCQSSALCTGVLFGADLHVRVFADSFVHFVSEFLSLSFGPLCVHHIRVADVSCVGTSCD